MPNELHFQVIEGDPFPHKVTVMFSHDDFWMDMADWCEEQLGQGAMSLFDTTVMNPLWMQALYGFSFKHEKDAFAFKMRWG